MRWKPWSLEARTKASLVVDSSAPFPDLDELMADFMSKVSFEEQYCQSGRRVGKQAHVIATKSSIILQIHTPV